MRLVLVALVALCLTGCDTNKSTVVGPSESKSHQDISFKSRIFYTSCGTYVGSYSNDFIGPMPEGYCQQNGAGIPSSCIIGSVSWRGRVYTWTEFKASFLNGDPTADE